MCPKKIFPTELLFKIGWEKLVNIRSNGCQVKRSGKSATCTDEGWTCRAGLSGDVSQENISRILVGYGTFSALFHATSLTVKLIIHPRKTRARDTHITGGAVTSHGSELRSVTHRPFGHESVQPYGFAG